MWNYLGDLAKALGLIHYSSLKCFTQLCLCHSGFRIRYLIKSYSNRVRFYLQLRVGIPGVGGFVRTRDRTPDMRSKRTAGTARRHVCRSRVGNIELPVSIVYQMTYGRDDLLVQQYRYLIAIYAFNDTPQCDVLAQRWIEYRQKSNFSNKFSRE